MPPSLHFYKRQQWLISNFSLLAFAGVYAIKQKEPIVGYCVLVALALFIGLFATYCLVHTQIALGPCRKRLVYIYKKHFSAIEQQKLDLDIKPRGFLGSDLFFVGLLIAIVGSMFLTIFLVGVPNASR